MTKKKKKHIKNLTLIIGVACGLCFSVVGNIIEAVIVNSVSNENEEIVLRLNNYRELQQTQIAAVKNHCADIESNIQTLSIYHNFFKLYSDNLASTYRVNIHARCMIPAYVVAGYESMDKVFDDYDGINQKLFGKPGGTYSHIEDNGF